jgi:hypothetical protein
MRRRCRPRNYRHRFGLPSPNPLKNMHLYSAGKDEPVFSQRQAGEGGDTTPAAIGHIESNSYLHSRDWQTASCRGPEAPVTSEASAEAVPMRKRLRH